MRLDNLSPDDKPYEVDGLPTLYGRKGTWSTALPMPLTSTLQHSLDALPLRGHASVEFAEPGEVEVTLSADDRKAEAPSSTLLATARWLVDNDATVERAIIDTLVSSLPELIEIQDGIYMDEEADERVSETWDEAQLRPRVRLLAITVPDVAGEPPYFGVELACSWDTEHGYGIMFHGTDVVEWGGADVPNLPWIANRHAEGRV